MLGASKVNTHSYDALIRMLHKASLGLGLVNHLMATDGRV